MRARASSAVLAIASTLVALLLAEAVMASFLPLDAQRSRYLHLRNVFQYDRAHVVHDDELGYRMRPGLDVTFENSEIGGFSTRISTNRDGFRDLASDSPRCLFLGDSFVFGPDNRDGREDAGALHGASLAAPPDVRQRSNQIPGRCPSARTPPSIGFRKHIEPRRRPR